jgi:hypothetical protein
MSSNIDCHGCSSWAAWTDPASKLKLSQLSTEFGSSTISQAITNDASGAKNWEPLATDEFEPKLRPSQSHLPVDKMFPDQKPKSGWRLKM